MDQGSVDLVSTCSESGPTAEQKILSLVAELRPAAPLHIFRKPILMKRAYEFLELFPGDVMYAVKCNPHEVVLETLVEAGIRVYDAASIDEVRLVKRLAPQAKIHFMHTVKSREAIREAYFTHNVRVFVIDSLAELHKIVHETDLAGDLEIFVRLALSKNKEALVDFSSKFGASAKECVKLLREARLVSAKIGLMFHPGTQSTNPEIYKRGIETAAEIIRKSGVLVDALDVGGGFPAPYLGSNTPAFVDYITEIKHAIAANRLDSLKLYCEPGRALTAESGLLVVRVEQRRGKSLYINDGVYGGLIEAAKWAGELRFPVTFLSQDAQPLAGCLDDTLCDAAFTEFRFCGPTCDSLDMMRGPFLLPDIIREGDMIIIHLTGAYSNACRTTFNGFKDFNVISVDF